MINERICDICGAELLAFAHDPQPLCNDCVEYAGFLQETYETGSGTSTIVQSSRCPTLHLYSDFSPGPPDALQLPRASPPTPRVTITGPAHAARSKGTGPSAPTVPRPPAPAAPSRRHPEPSAPPAARPLTHAPRASSAAPLAPSPMPPADPGDPGPLVGGPTAFDAAQLHLLRPVAEGGQSRIWRATYKGTPVAVKRPLESVPERWVQNMLRAHRLQQRVSHPHVVGVLHVQDGPGPYVVLEYCAQGDAALHYPTGLARRLQWQWAWDIAQGLRALHGRSPPIAHRDVKASNALIAADGRAKLGDFDMAVEAPAPVTGAFGTPGFTAPEVLLGLPYDQSVDVYSYASFLYELTHAVPPFWADVPDADTKEYAVWGQAVSALVKQGQHPSLSSGKCCEPLGALMTECWAQEPKLRPSMDDILLRLETMKHLHAD